ncbi:M28 family peptidase [Flavobacteriaceae sp. LMIT009]
MNKLTFLLVFSIFSVLQVASQTVTDLMNSVNQDTLVKVIREFSGEDATVVNGNPVTILNRESNANDVAADYLVERLAALSNITVSDIGYSVNGRNIVASQLGKTNPNDIYIICAHYDTVNNYCADDNASGTAAILEVARILSTQCFDNTIIYAFWDEEEQGLLGAANYAANASTNGDNILGVYNIDMMAYDGDGDNVFDIDVRNIAGSIALKDDLLAVLASSSLNLNVNVVDPGTPLSDHKPFWDQGYSAMLVGESWGNNDQTPNYHTANDRFADLDMDYFTDLTKLATAFMATKGSLLAVDNTVTIGGAMLTSNQLGASYRWLDCDNNMAVISGEVSQSFTPSSNGSYAVEVTSDSCVEISECINFNTLGVDQFTKDEIDIFPNPVTSKLQVNLKVIEQAQLSILNIEGKKVLELQLLKKLNEIDMSNLSNGVYFIKVISVDKEGAFKIVKE